MSEILGALFKYLVALLAVSAIVLMSYNVFGSNKTQNAISDLSLLQTNVQQLYNGQASFATLTNTVAINGKLAPAGMTVPPSTTALQNPWGGTITVAPNTNTARFDVTETAVPAESCAKMAVAMGAAVALSVNGTAQTLPLDAGTAVTACNVTAAAGNTLVMTFSK